MGAQRFTFQQSIVRLSQSKKLRNMEKGFAFDAKLSRNLLPRNWFSWNVHLAQITRTRDAICSTEQTKDFWSLHHRQECALIPPTMSYLRFDFSSSKKTMQTSADTA